jgi:DNA-directed RNA polymerase subunit RPC12/RpoP
MINLLFEQQGQYRSGLWVASCADCGYELGSSLSQAGAERHRFRRCPICGTRSLRRR